MLVEVHRFIVLEYDAESKGSFSPRGGRVVLKIPALMPVSFYVSKFLE